MDNNTIALLMGAIASLIIFYFIIQSAVASATREANRELVNLAIRTNRLLAILASKNGVTRAEIDTLYDGDLESFRTLLQTPEEKAAREAEIAKITAYQNK